MDALRELLDVGRENEEYVGRDVLFLVGIQAAANSMNEKWCFCNADDAACMKDHLRIDFLNDRVRSIWLGSYLGTKEPKRVTSQRLKPAHPGPERIN